MRGTPFPSRPSHGDAKAGGDSLGWLDRHRSEDAAHQSDQGQLLLLRGLIQRHPAGILVVGDDGRILAASDTFCRLFSQTPANTDAPPLDPAAWASDPERFRRRVAFVVSERRAVASEEVP